MDSKDGSLAMPSRSAIHHELDLACATFHARGWDPFFRDTRGVIDGTPRPSRQYFRRVDVRALASAALVLTKGPSRDEADPDDPQRVGVRV